MAEVKPGVWFPLIMTLVITGYGSEVSTTETDDTEIPDPDALMMSIWNDLARMQRVASQNGSDPTKWRGLADRLGGVQVEVTALNSNLSTLNRKFISAAETTITLMGSFALATRTNSRRLKAILARLDYLEKELGKKSVNLDKPATTTKRTSSPALPSNSAPVIIPASDTVKVAPGGQSDAGVSDDVSEFLRLDQDDIDDCKGINLLHHKKVITKAVNECKESVDFILKVMTGISKRVAALEKRNSDTETRSTAFDDVSRDVKRVTSGMEIFGRGQAKVNKKLGSKVTELERKLAVIGKTMKAMQKRMIVDSSTLILQHKYLNSAVRVRFQKNFSHPPEVYAAISGFAMDPDHAPLNIPEASKLNISNIRDLDKNNIQVTVQSRNYAPRVGRVTDIDKNGFSLTVHDGRHMKYSAFHWIQVQWLAIGN